ncbi:MAG: DMT family transporter [Chloroflexi bacterium]|nr:DMT family transporter [Chloroflexota bacterium]
MTNSLYLTVAVLVGVGAATQSALLAAMGRDKGPYEGTWINMLAAIGGLSVILVARAMLGRSPMLPSPFNHALAFAVVIGVTGVALAISVRGLNPVYAITGLFAIAYLLGIGYGAPRIGIALFVAGVTVGQLGGALAYDHVGAFGLDVHHASVTRVAGLAVVLAGALIVRFAP